MTTNSPTIGGSNGQGKKRIEWIDALRGFTMILVVMAHVELIGMDMQSNPITVFFTQFHMPLFFFLSGYTAYRVDEAWNRQHYSSQMLKKLRILIIPTILFGVLFAIIIHSHIYEITATEAIGALIDSPMKLGYWFTLVLLVMFFIYYTVSLALARCRLGVRQIVLAGIGLILYFLTLRGTSFYYSIPVVRWLCLFNVMLYFQFFVFGNLFACYQHRLFRILENQYIIGIIILALFGFHIGHCFLSSADCGQSAVGIVSNKLIVECVRYLGILTVVAFFKHYGQSFSSTTRLGRSLQYVGRRTLDVYLLQYFFIPILPQYAIFANNPTLMTAVSLGLAILIILFCLLVSNIIRVSPFLAKYLFGAKSNQKQASTPSISK